MTFLTTQKKLRNGKFIKVIKSWSQLKDANQELKKCNKRPEIEVTTSKIINMILTTSYIKYE